VTYAVGRGEKGAVSLEQKKGIPSSFGESVRSALQHKKWENGNLPSAQRKTGQFLVLRGKERHVDDRVQKKRPATLGMASSKTELTRRGPRRKRRFGADCDRTPSHSRKEGREARLRKDHR